MKRISGFNSIFKYLLLMSAVMTVGCTKQSALTSADLHLSQQQTDEDLLAAIEKLRTKSDEFNISKGMYRRQMVIDFNEGITSITEHQQKVIKLFFQTLPASNNINIIITAAPSSKTGFAAINDAWVRIKLLSHHLKIYSEQIEELYLPDQKVDTVTIQVLGGERVE